MPVVGGRSGNLDKILWEMRGVAGAARRRARGPAACALPVGPASHAEGDQDGGHRPRHDPMGTAGLLGLRLRAPLPSRRRLRCPPRRPDPHRLDASRRDVLKVLRVPAARSHTVYLGMEAHPTYTPDRKADVRARHNLPENYIFYLGGFDKRKNVPLLLQAWHAALPQLDRSDDKPPVLAIGGGVPPPAASSPTSKAKQNAWVPRNQRPCSLPRQSKRRRQTSPDVYLPLLRLSFSLRRLRSRPPRSYVRRRPRRFILRRLPRRSSRRRRPSRPPQRPQNAYPGP